MGVDIEKHEFLSFGQLHKPGRLWTVFALLPYMSRRKCQFLYFGVLDGGRRAPPDITSPWDSVVIFLNDLQGFHGKSMKPEM